MGRPILSGVLISGLIVVILLLAGCTGPAQDGADGDGTGDTDEEGPVSVSGFEWGFDPARIETQSGQETEIAFTNDGEVAHNLGGDFGRTETIGAGATDTITVTFDEPGEVAYWCSVPGHRDKGMEGTIVVS